jgi:hypothetical protein
MDGLIGRSYGVAAGLRFVRLEFGPDECKGNKHDHVKNLAGTFEDGIAGKPHIIQRDLEPGAPYEREKANVRSQAAYIDNGVV